MRKKRKYIAIEGPIGVGKTSLAKLLSEKLDGEPILEEVEENPFLEKFYEDRSFYAFQAQMFFLVSRYKQLSALSQTDLFKTAPVADYIFARDMIFARINLNDQEYRLYIDIYNMMKKNVPRPDLVIYLQADTKTLVSRTRQRGREMEKSLREDYLDEVNRAFNEFFFNYRSGPLLIINTSNIDFVANEEDLEKLLSKVTGDIKGREFFNPLGSVF
ncbi:MAG: deoxynucleoside kinase [Candidatus Nitrospinota bacterium M3_3B_026]